MILPTHPHLDLLRRWHRREDSLFTTRDYLALETRGLLARESLGGYRLAPDGRDLLAKCGALRTVLTGGRF